MPKPKVLIAGGGPAGLTAAYELSKKNIPATVLESSSFLGGLSQTVEYKGYRFDIGGHRFFTKNKEIDVLWTEMLPGGFIEVDRISRIYYKKKFFSYPLKPIEAFINLGLIESFMILLSYVKSKIKPRVPETSFEDWVINRFGSRLYRIFFKTYTEKVWGMPCSKISADWASQRIKGLSLTTAIKNAFFSKKNSIKTLIDRFRYPRLGPGMLWNAVGRNIEEKGGRVVRNQKVVAIKRNNYNVESITAEDPEGKKSVYKCTHFVSSMPLRDLMLNMSPSPQKEVMDAAAKLTYRDFLVVAAIIEKDKIFPDNWVYIHDGSVRLGRIQNFKNWSKEMVPDEGYSCLGLEYFCSEGDDLWSMSDKAIAEFAIKELEQIGLCDSKDVRDTCVVKMYKAYPVYDTDYQKNIEIIRNFINKFKNLYPIGRNGMHRYNNQDHSMATALLAARNILGAKYDVWQVNSDAEYHEEIKDRLVPKPL